VPARSIVYSEKFDRLIKKMDSLKQYGYHLGDDEPDIVKREKMREEFIFLVSNIIQDLFCAKELFLAGYANEELVEFLQELNIL
jgi:hypothetical protein